MNDLAIRKRLLVAESELNRAGLAASLVEWRYEVRGLARRATDLGSLAAMGLELVTVLARRPAREQPAWSGLLAAAASWWSSRRP